MPSIITHRVLPRLGFAISTLSLCCALTINAETFSSHGTDDLSSRLNPQQFIKVILKDGSQVMLNPNGIDMSVRTEYGKSKIPMGSLRAVKFVSTNDSTNPDEVIVRFQSELIKRMKVNSWKHYITASDGQQNRIKIYTKDIQGILGPVFLSHPSTRSSTSIDKLWHYTATMRDGSTRRFYVPTSMFKIKTGNVSMPLSTPMIHSITYYPEEEAKHEITTIYGEVIRGTISERRIRIVPENDDAGDFVYFKDLKKLVLDDDIESVPPGWLVWYIKPGLAVAGCFSKIASGLISKDGKPIPTESVYSITQINDGDIVCILKNGIAFNCTPLSHDASLYLLSSGTTIEVPWSDICEAKMQSTITAKDLMCLMVDNDKSIKAGKRSDSAEYVKIRTSIGSLDIMPSRIATITVNQTQSRSCLSTIYGDRLIIPTPSKSWFAQLLETEDYAFPDEDIFTIKLRDIMQPPQQQPLAVCRTKDGSIFYGTLPKDQDISIKRTRKGSKPTPLNIAALKQVSLDEDGNMYFILEQGEVSATPKQSKIAIKLFITDDATDYIDFKDIETLTTNGKLPPTTIFSPGLPHFLQNEVLIKRGSFQQGSADGMDDEQPVHEVSLSPFYIDATEVTRAQFAAFLRDSGYKTTANLSDSKLNWKEPGFKQDHSDPAVCVSWYDAVEFCNWRSRKSGLEPCYVINKNKAVETDRTANGYRLPTEAEWEFAARSRGLDTLYACEYDKDHNLLANAKGTTAADSWNWTNPVKFFPPNEIGLYGMSGNVWEWCEDWYFNKAYASLKNRQNHNPCIEKTPTLTRRVMRGGSFRNSPDLLRCTSRGNGPPYAFAVHVGFRCARNAN